MNDCRNSEIRESVVGEDAVVKMIISILSSWRQRLLATQGESWSMRFDGGGGGEFKPRDFLRFWPLE